MTTLTILVDSGNVERTLAKLQAAFMPVPMSGFLRGPVTEILQERADKRFASEGDSASGAWAPLTAATVAIRQEKGYGAGPINVRTGEMRDFILGAEGAYASAMGDSVLSWPQDSATGELAEKMTTAQQGKQSPKTPARPVVAVGLEDQLMVTNALEAYIKGVMAL